RCVAKLVAELLATSFLPFPHFAAVDHDIICIALSLDLDLAKFDQSRFHFSMFRWLEFQGKRPLAGQLRAIRFFEQIATALRCLRVFGRCAAVLSSLSLSVNE